MEDTSQREQLETDGHSKAEHSPALIVPGPEGKPQVEGGQVAFFVARLVPSLMGLVTTLILAHLLGPAAYGTYAFGLTLVFLMTTGAFEWLGLSMIRFALQAQGNAVFLETVVCFFVLIAAGLAVIGAAIAWYQHDLRTSLLILACWCAAVASAWNELKQRLQMIEFRVRSYLVTGVLRGIACMILVQATAVWTSDPILTLFALALATWAAGLFERRPSIMKLRSNREVVGSLLHFGLPLLASVLLGTVRQSVDKTLLQMLAGPESVGFFTAATMISQVPIQTLAGSIGVSGYAAAVRALELGDSEAVQMELTRNFTFLLVLVLPSAVGSIAIAHHAATILLPPVYWAEVDRLTPWLAVTSVFLVLRGFYIDYAFQLAHRTRTLIVIISSSVVLNVIGDWLLIPGSGEMGAAVGSLIASVASLLVGLAASRTAYKLPFPLLATARVGIATGVMYGAVTSFPIHTSSLGLVLRIILGVLCYASCLAAFNVLDCRDWLSTRMRQICKYRLRFGGKRLGSLPLTATANIDGILHARPGESRPMVPPPFSPTPVDRTSS